MTSYLRYIFGGRDRESHGQQSSKSHSRSRSSASSNYIYANAGNNAPAPAAPRLKTKRSNSYSARTTTPSPLRYATFEATGQVPSSSGDSRYGTPSKSHLYRRASYKSSEHLPHYGMYTPSSVAHSASYGPSSRTNSSSSLLPGMARPGSSGSSSIMYGMRGDHHFGKTQHGMAARRLRQDRFTPMREVWIHMVCMVCALLCTCIHSSRRPGYIARLFLMMYHILLPLAPY